MISLLLHVMPQDELCLLSPTFAPSFFYVGKLLIDIPLAFNLGRPLKITVSDVLAVLRAGGHVDMTPEVSECGCCLRDRSWPADDVLYLLQ